MWNIIAEIISGICPLKDRPLNLLLTENLLINNQLVSSNFTWEVVKCSRDVLGGISIGGVADNQAGFPHSPVPHQDALHPLLRCSGSHWPCRGPPRPARDSVPAPDPPRGHRRSRGHRCRFVDAITPLGHLARRGGWHGAGGDPGGRFSPAEGQFSLRPFFRYHGAVCQTDFMSSPLSASF